MVRDENKWLILAVILILAGGAVLVLLTAQLEDNRLREDLLVKTRFMERGIRYEQVKSLTGTASDLDSADYKFLKWQMQQMRSADPHIRFTYLIGKRPDGMLIFLVDSESPDSEGYSPPGQKYPEASAELKAIFDSPAEFTGGPYTDRWGTWISAFVPLVDPMTEDVIAVYGIDIDATDWIALVIIACIPVIVGILVIVLILLVFINIRRRDRREKEILEESEKELRESERRLNDIINFLPDPTLAIDLDGRVISWNKAIEEMTGIPAGEMLGKGNYEYALPFYGERRKLLIDIIFEPDEVIAKNYANIIREKDVLIADTSVPRPRGRAATLMGKASPLYNRKGEIVGAIESIRDVTSRKKAEDVLRQTNNKLNLMNSITRHDILNQITAITGYLDLLKSTVPDPAVTAYIDPALLASDNIKKYIRFSKEYQEIGVQSPRWFAIKNLISSAAGGLPLATVTFVLDLDDVEIFADPLLEKVFYTLLENALRHGHGVKKIRFSSRRSGASLVLTCEDDGPGVPAEYKERIFDRTYYKHTGYGLFLSREILAITGITITENGEYMKGARFEITVPEGAYRFTNPG